MSGPPPGPRAAAIALPTALRPLPLAWESLAGRRDAAVLVPLVAGAEGVRLLFTRRRADLARHAGQIAFPGGLRDGDADPDPVSCALREFEEELGLSRQRVQVLGGLPCRDSSTGFHVHPVVGVLHDLQGLTPHAGEVEAVFEVPLPELGTPGRWRWREVLRGEQRLRSPEFEAGEGAIWGLTARIVRDLLALSP